MYKKDCFAFHKYTTGLIKCNALVSMSCNNCKFYRTKEDYSKNVAILEHK